MLARQPLAESPSLVKSTSSDYPPSQPVGSEFEPLWRPLPAKLPSFGGCSLETLSYLI